LFDTRLSQDAIAEPPGVLVRVNGYPDFFAGRGMFQWQVTAFPGPGLDESCGLQLADHLGPGHLAIVNLSLGFVNATNWWSESMGSIPVCGRGCDRPQVLDFDGRVRW
jgi:hypothetical protein